MRFTIKMDDDAVAEYGENKEPGDRAAFYIEGEVIDNVAGELVIDVDLTEPKAPRNKESEEREIEETEIGGAVDTVMNQ